MAMSHIYAMNEWMNDQKQCRNHSVLKTYTKLQILFLNAVSYILNIKCIYFKKQELIFRFTDFLQSICKGNISNIWPCDLTESLLARRHLYISNKTQTDPEKQDWEQKKKDKLLENLFNYTWNLP